MVESVIKCYALYLFLPCATRPNGSGHPGRCGNAACKGQNFHAELCPLSISPEIVGSRLNNGAASVFLRALGERHGGLQHALHCFWRKAPRFVIARRPEADVAISRHMPNNRKTIGEIAAAFPRLHPKGTSSRFALRAPRPLRGLAMTSQGGFPHPEGRKGKPESRCGRRAASANPYAISGNCYISHSADRSTHLGFIVATSASFLLRDQPLICFSRSIAVLTSGVVSK